MSNTQLQIRPATVADAAVMVTILHAAFEEYRGKLDPPSGAHRETLESVLNLLAHEHGLLALCDGRAVGCVFFDVRPDELYLHRLSVLPEFRRQGISKALVDAVEAHATELGKAKVTLIVRVALPQNRAYYEKLGYAITEFDFHDGYTQFTSVSMAKILDAPNIRNVEVVPYNPEWPAQFAAEAALLRRVFGNQLLAIHHIGSTSIPGMHAKPIIDMMPIVLDIKRMYAFDPTMLALGYEALGEFGLAGRRYYRKGGHLHRSHHVHVYEAQHPEFERHLAFRDYMIAHPAEATIYSELKQRLAHQHPHDIYAYMDGKDALIKEMEAKALVWWRAAKQG